jgi:hypothetical protein
MEFTETWIPEVTLSRLQDLVRSTEHKRGAVLEFGVWEGRSFAAIAEAAAPRLAHAVDHWRGSLSDDDMTLNLAQERDVFAAYSKNTAHLDNVVTHRVDTAEFMDCWDDPISFLHLDADHGYQSVKAQILWAKKLLVPGGVLCGDDYSERWPGVVEAVRETLPTATIEHYMWIYWNF